MKSLAGYFIAVLALMLVCRPAEAGTCKLSIMIDRSGSMKTVRPSDNRTRCEVATAAAVDAINAFAMADLYKVNEGRQFSSSDVYDLNCPAGGSDAEKLVSIWGFEHGVFTHITNGFVPFRMAVGLLQTSPYYKNVAPAGSTHPVYAPAECDYGETPLAQGMCESARDFPTGALPTGEVRSGIILTDGEENASEHTIAVTFPYCRLAGETDSPDLTNPNNWASRVKSEYLSRHVSTYGFLFDDGGTISAAAVAAKAGGSAQTKFGDFGPRGIQSGGLSALALPLSPRAYPAALDTVFLQGLATQTGGTYNTVLDSAAVSPGASLVDTDGDGIPDFRDLCDAKGCVDQDFDGIPDVIDQCLFTLEDGNGPNPADGCPDGDADGIPDDRDQCATKREDYVPPKPTDGCPAPAAPAPAMPAGLAILLGLGMLGCGCFVVTRKPQKRAVSLG